MGRHHLSSRLAESGSSSVPFPVLRRAMICKQTGAWLSTAQAISMQQTATHKRSINSLRMERALFSSGPSAFAPGAYPVGLAFDSSGNLFVSVETFTDPGANSIVYFTQTGVGSTFATGLTFPRGLAF